MSLALSRTQTPLAGIVFMLGAMAVLPFLDVVAKLLGQQNVPVVEIVWARLFFGVLLTLPFVLPGRGARVFIPTTPVLQTLRCFFNVAATVCFFWALKYLPIADTLAIFFVQPLIVTLLSPLILRETVGLRRWSAVFIGFIGTLVIIRPGFQAINPGVLLALGAGSLSALYIMLTRMIAGKADPIVTTFHTNLVSAVMVSAALPFFWQMPTAEQWGLVRPARDHRHGRAFHDHSRLPSRGSIAACSPRLYRDDHGGFRRLVVLWRFSRSLDVPRCRHADRLRDLYLLSRAPARHCAEARAAGALTDCRHRSAGMRVGQARKSAFFVLIPADRLSRRSSWSRRAKTKTRSPFVAQPTNQPQPFVLSNAPSARRG